MSKPDDYLWDRSGPADPEVQRLEQLLAPLAHDRPLDELKLRRPKRSRAPWIIGGAVALAAAAALLLYLRASGGKGPCFEYSGGSGEGCLAVGETLDTGTATAKLAIADIGNAELGAGTRVRLVRSETGKRQELHLERGRMHARVDAPPRIFAITTPSSGVTDLGCEYTIEVDAEGKGTIEVLSGRVLLESDQAPMVAPAGTAARMLAKRKPSVPLVVGANVTLRNAVTEWENGAPGALDRVLPAAGAADAITLANLAFLVAGQGANVQTCDAPCSDRERVLNRLAEISPPPDGVTVHGAVTDAKVLEKWREEIVLELIAASLEEQLK